MHSNRRDFLRSVGFALASTQLLPGQAPAEAWGLGAEPSIQSVIDAILAEIPVRRPNTVDTVKHGDPGQRLKGIATTFLPSCDVIERAAAAGANLLIAHEPVFYNHQDETDWLEQDAIYQRKRRLLDETGMVLWRFHDHWHRLTPDPVSEALLDQLELADARRGDDNYFVTIQATPLGELAAAFKRRLGVPLVRVIGDPATPCSRLGILPGAWGGRMQIGLLGRERPDLLVCGEINEWETSVYVQDAIWAGRSTSLLILGHVNTEEPGMKALVEWLEPRLPDVPIVHVPMGDPFLYL